MKKIAETLDAVQLSTAIN